MCLSNFTKKIYKRNKACYKIQIVINGINNWVSMIEHTPLPIGRIVADGKKDIKVNSINGGFFHSFEYESDAYAEIHNSRLEVDYSCRIIKCFIPANLEVYKGEGLRSNGFASREIINTDKVVYLSLLKIKKEK